MARIPNAREFLGQMAGGKPQLVKGPQFERARGRGRGQQVVVDDSMSKALEIAAGFMFQLEEKRRKNIAMESEAKIRDGALTILNEALSTEGINAADAPALVEDGFKGLEEAALEDSERWLRPALRASIAEAKSNTMATVYEHAREEQDKVEEAQASHLSASILTQKEKLAIDENGDVDYAAQEQLVGRFRNVRANWLDAQFGEGYSQTEAGKAALEVEVYEAMRQVHKSRVYQLANRGNEDKAVAYMDKNYGIFTPAETIKVKDALEARGLDRIAAEFADNASEGWRGYEEIENSNLTPAQKRESRRKLRDRSGTLKADQSDMILEAARHIVDEGWVTKAQMKADPLYNARVAQDPFWELFYDRAFEEEEDGNGGGLSPTQALTAEGYKQANRLLRANGRDRARASEAASEEFNNSEQTPTDAVIYKYTLAAINDIRDTSLDGSKDEAALKQTKDNILASVLIGQDPRDLVTLDVELSVGQEFHRQVIGLHGVRLGAMSRPGYSGTAETDKQMDHLRFLRDRGDLHTIAVDEWRAIFGVLTSQEVEEVDAWNDAEQRRIAKGLPSAPSFNAYETAAKLLNQPFIIDTIGTGAKSHIRQQAHNELTVIVDNFMKHTDMTPEDLIKAGGVVPELINYARDHFKFQRYNTPLLFDEKTLEEIEAEPFEIAKYVNDEANFRVEDMSRIQIDNMSKLRVTYAPHLPLESFGHIQALIITAQNDLHPELQLASNLVLADQLGDKGWAEAVAPLLDTDVMQSVLTDMAARKAAWDAQKEQEGEFRYLPDPTVDPTELAQPGGLMRHRVRMAGLEGRDTETPEDAGKKPVEVKSKETETPEDAGKKPAEVKSKEMDDLIKELDDLIERRNKAMDSAVHLKLGDLMEAEDRLADLLDRGRRGEGVNLGQLMEAEERLAELKSLSRYEISPDELAVIEELMAKIRDRIDRLREQQK